MLKIMFRVMVLVAVAACVDPEPGVPDNAVVYGGDKDRTDDTIVITITDKVPQLPDCAGLAKTCKWEMRVTMSRYHAYIWGTGTWETEWTYELQVSFIPYDCDGKKQGYYNSNFPATKKNPGDLIQQLINIIKKRGGFSVDAELGTGDKSCYLDRAQAEQHFWMLFDYVVSLLKKNQKVTHGDAASTDVVVADAPDEFREGMARSVAQAFRAVAQDIQTGTDDEESPNLAVATEWLMTAFDYFDRVPVIAEPVASYPTDLVATTMPAVCACAAVIAQ